MKGAWIVVVTTTSGNPPHYYYGPFYDKIKAETFTVKECDGFQTQIVELIVVER